MSSVRQITFFRYANHEIISHLSYIFKSWYDLFHFKNRNMSPQKGDITTLKHGVLQKNPKWDQGLLKFSPNPNMASEGSSLRDEAHTLIWRYRTGFRHSTGVSSSRVRDVMLYRCWSMWTKRILYVICIFSPGSSYRFLRCVIPTDLVLVISRKFKSLQRIVAKSNLN